MKLRPIHAAWAMALAYFLVLWATAPKMGFTRDEGYYFKAAEEYSRWWGVLFSSRFLEAFGDAEIARHFSYNWEHPALVKLSQGATYHLLHGFLGLASPAQGFRAAGFLFGALSLIATFLLGRELVSARVGLLAAALLAVLPRYFYDAHLACFDVPITAMWTFSLVYFVRALEAPKDEVVRRAVLAGVFFGLALATKLNALFLPFVFTLLWLVAPPDGLRVAMLRGPSGGRDVLLPSVPWALIACAVLGPLVFVAHWPYLWHDTFQRIGQYLGFHLHHEHYPISYFFKLWVRPPFPWSFPMVMSLVTLPGTVIALGSLGLLVSVFRMLRRRSLADTALVVSAVLPVFLIALPSTPIFGGVKHWYNAMPALLVLTARSTFWASDELLRHVGPRVRWAPAAGLSALVLLPGLLGTAHAHPNGIGYYNELVGGFGGGAKLGMQRLFWSGLAGPLVEAVPSLAPPKSRIFFNRTNYDSYRMYQREDLLPPGTFYANEARGADLGFVFEQPEHGEQEGAVWSVLGTRPIGGVYQDNVTLVQLYQRGPSSQAPRDNGNALR